MPYLLLLDIRMPKVDGIEVLRQIKQDPELRKIPVIILTTDDRAKWAVHAIDARQVVKTVDYNKFAEAIKGLGLHIPGQVPRSMTSCNPAATAMGAGLFIVDFPSA
jgi:CheY-like chemotaxis protein